MRNCHAALFRVPRFAFRVAALSALLPVPAAAQAPEVLLATTTSTRDAGLLDTLLPVFERLSGYRVKVVAVGSGHALEMGRRGDADVVLSHAPQAEQALVDSGYFGRRLRVMHNDFVIVGPPDDPAGLRALVPRDAAAALRRLAERRDLFVSRGDRSGTHLLELRLWGLAGVRPPPPTEARWYLEAGQGMAATLQIADQKAAYTLTDRATYLAWRDKLRLVPLVEGDERLYNVYHVMEASAQAGARALVDFLVSPAAQRIIAEFGKERFGQPLFVPDAAVKKPGPTGSRVESPS
ncbi:MAG: substrate-binding domain-containing protein [Gemmatimonadales bacterium]